MKKFLNKLFILIFMLVLVVPFGVFAEGEEETTDEDVTEEKSPVKVYEFYGSTCGYCASLNEWFDSIEEEYGDYFDLVKLEVWENTDNSSLMDSVANTLGITVTGIPFVVIGENYSTGFDSATTPDTILGYIMSEYEKDDSERVDIVNAVGDIVTSSEEETGDSGIIIGVVFAVIVVGTIVLVIKARKED